MKRGIFIQANAKQLLGAKIAKHAVEARGKARAHGIPVTIMEVEAMPAFKAFVGRPYRGGRPYTFDDLQSFTLTRFMPPELMGYEGRALVIDPDVFALADIEPLFALDLGEAAIACRQRPGPGYETSVMVLACERLRHWQVVRILEDIAHKRRRYEAVMRLEDEPAPILPLAEEWNALDVLTSETKILHTTVRLTQPWKTGLPIDFTREPLPRLFGLIPREPILRLLGSYPSRYQQHPDARTEALFFDLAREAKADGAVTDADISEAVAAGTIRPDFAERLAQTR